MKDFIAIVIAALILNAVICKPVICFAQYLPIKAVRTVAFTTDEGSYMNVDVSPDGKTLVFDLLGDLYTVPSTGGRATQLTRGISVHVRPIWSTDGREIAFYSDTSGYFGLCALKISKGLPLVIGTSRKIAPVGEDALWTHDDANVIVENVSYLISEGLKKSTICTKTALRFSPDGNWMYGLNSGRIVKWDKKLDNSAFISTKLKAYRYGVLSPDAHWWCYITDSNKQACLLAQNLLNGQSKILVASLLSNDPRYRPAMPIQHFSFSPDSKSIFIGYGGKIHHIYIQNGNNQIVPFVAHVKSDLGHFDYNAFRVSHNPFKVKYIRAASESPDRQHLLFNALGRLYIMDLPKGKIQCLVEQPYRQFQPVYSPDGRWIAYVTWCDTIGGFLWRVRPDGGRPERLSVIPGQYQQPTWSPDGKYLAVIRGEPKLGDRDDTGIGKLLLISLQDKTEQVIKDSLPLWNKLTFSKDGRRIFYSPNYVLWSQRGSSIPQFVSVNLKGKDPRVILVGGQFTAFDEKLLSPDGKFVILSAGEDLYLIPITDSTKPTTISDDRNQIPGIRLGSGIDPYWEDGGKMLAWGYANQFFRVSPDSVIALNDPKAFTPNASIRKDFVDSRLKPTVVAKINLSIPYYYGHGAIALTDARIITMEGNNVIEHGTVLVEDGRIKAVGKVGTVFIKPGTKIIDLNGATIMPGLVDVHLHMRVPSNIFPQQSWMFLINLAFGVTTARDPSLSFDSFGYAEMLESGQMIGPRLYTVGRAVRLGDEVIRVNSLSDAQDIVDKRALLGGTTIKQYLLPSRVQKEWLLMASTKAGLNMTNEGDEVPIFQLGMLKDGSSGVEHNAVWGDVYSDVVKFIAASQTYYTPTLQVCYGTEQGKEYFKYKYWRQPNAKLMWFGRSDPNGGLMGNGAESIETIMHSTTTDTIHPGFLAPAAIDTRILRAGGRLCVGSHGNDEGIGVHNEIWALQMGGFTNMEALQAATIMGARALGIQRDLGSIKVGKIADILVLNKNPLDDIHNTIEIQYVMKDGLLYDSNTLNLIWPIVKQCPDWKP